MKKNGNSVILILLPLFLIAAALLVGRYSLSLREIAQTLFHPSAASAEH